MTKLWAWHKGNPNSAHMPAYKRVDMRISKDLELFGFSASAFLDISNILNFKNIQSYRYTFNNNGGPLITEVKLWPILPTLGMTIRF